MYIGESIRHFLYRNAIFGIYYKLTKIKSEKNYNARNIGDNSYLILSIYLDKLFNIVSNITY